MFLSDIAVYVKDRVSIQEIRLVDYVTTDSLLQNKRGRICAQNLPPVVCNLTRFQKGDVLVANIRPYLKKIWFADCSGGCSSDVLVFRAKPGHCPNFLYAVLMQDSFYDLSNSNEITSYRIKCNSDEQELPTNKKHHCKNKALKYNVLIT